MVRAFIKNFSYAFIFPICCTMYFFQHNRTAYDHMCGSVVVEELPRTAFRNHWSLCFRIKICIYTHYFWIKLICSFAIFFIWKFWLCHECVLMSQFYCCVHENLPLHGFNKNLKNFNTLQLLVDIRVSITYMVNLL